MTEDQEYVETKTHYSNISYKKRLKLIEMTESKGYSIYRVAKLLNMPNSTAKLIVKHYREEGRIFQKKSHQKLPMTPTAEVEAKAEVSHASDHHLSSQLRRKQFYRVLNGLAVLNNCWLQLLMNPMIGQ